MGIWSWIDSEEKRARWTFLGAGGAAVLAGLWAAFVYFYPPKAETKAAGTSVTATGGGVAVGGSVTNSNVKTGSPPSEKK